MAIRGHKNLRALLAAIIVSLAVAQAAVAESPKRFQSETPAPRIDYWQEREAEIVTQISGVNDLSAVKLVFIGDSITDFWHLDKNP